MSTEVPSQQQIQPFLMAARARAKIVVLLLLAGSSGLTEPSPSRLPPIPAISESTLNALDPSVREQIQKALRDTSSHPLDAAANGHLGMLLQAYELYGFAAACYERAHRLDPHAFAWIYYLAIVRISAGGDPPTQIALLQEALHLNPNYLPARIKLAEQLLSGGTARDREALVDSLVQAAPRSARVHYLAGRVREAVGELPAAAEEYQQTLKIAPQYGSAHYALAMAYRRLGRADESQQEMRLYRSTQNLAPPEDDELLEAIDSLKTGPYDHLNRAQSFQDSGRNEEAVREYDAALEMDPGLLRAHVNLIIIFGAQRKFAEAEQHYREAIAINPNSAEAYYNYGLVLSSEQKFVDAEQAFKKAIEISPTSADAFNNLGFALESQSKIPEAEANYRNALRNEPGHRQANFNLARLLESRGDVREAINCLVKAVAVEDDKTSVFMYYLSEAYARDSEFGRALYYAQEAKHRAAEFHQSELSAVLDRRIDELKKSANLK